MPGIGGKGFEDTLDFSWDCLGNLSDELPPGILIGEIRPELCVIAHTGTAHSKVERSSGTGAASVQYLFGEYGLDTDRRELRRGSELVSIGPQGFDVLIYLIINRERVVSKDDLIDAVWRGRTVSDSTLASQINAVRKSIGDNGEDQKLVRTIARKGFRFIGSVQQEPSTAGVGSVKSAPLLGRRVEAQDTPTLSVPDKPSIAVLPFENLSGDPEQEYFADGMVEDIITSLSRLRWLFVIARNSSFTYKGRPVDVKQVGRELGVRYVLEGSVRKAGGRVRISAQIIETETGIHLWAESYDRASDEIFALQDEVTMRVVGTIVPSLREAEIERVKRKRPESLGAHDLVMRALPHFFTAMPEGAAKALPLLERSLALEADYSTAHGLLACCHEFLFTRAGFRIENRNAAIRHAHAAIIHGRDDALALAMGAFVIAMMEHDRVTAFETFKQAIAVSPCSPYTYFLGGIALAYGCEAERAIDWAERGLRLSPFDRLKVCSYHALAIGHFLRERYEEAADAGRRAVQCNPGFSVSQSLLVAPLVKLGRMEEAKAVALRVMALQPSFSTGGFCAALAVPPALATPLTETWRTAGLPP
jgi:TolB-like protein